MQKGVTGMGKTKNRWLIALAAVGIHISIGSVYSWSVFTNPLGDAHGWSLSEVQLTFSIAILFLGLSAAFMGHFVEKYGPKKSGLVSTICFGIGIIGAGFANQIGSLYLLYFFYGVLGGIGLGIGYITPVSSLVKWFPDRRGLATGLAIMGFGFASLIASPVFEWLIGGVGISATFYITGAVYFVLMLGSSLYLAPPPKGWQPKNMKQEKKEKSSSKDQSNTDLSQLTANEAVKTVRFWALWIMLFINVSCGIAIISVASPMAQDVAGLSVAAAATMVGIMGLFNGFGRIGWASVSDYIGRPNVYTAFFVIQLIAFALLPMATNELFFQLLIFIILSCYGGGFASIPAYIGDLFGTKQLGAIHGYILTAWAAAGLAGPLIVASLREATQSYTLTMYIFAGAFVVALVVSLLIRMNIKKIREQSSTS